MNSVQVYKPESTKTLAMLDGCEVALRWFGMTESDIERDCGRFLKGKNKGKLRGWIIYQKIEVGGWNYAMRCVFKPGMIFAHFCKTYDDISAVLYPKQRGCTFFHGATRVDTCYGFDPARAREAKNAQAAALAEQAERGPRYGLSIRGVTNETAIRGYTNSPAEVQQGITSLKESWARYANTAPEVIIWDCWNNCEAVKETRELLLKAIRESIDQIDCHINERGDISHVLTTRRHLKDLLGIE